MPTARDLLEEVDAMMRRNRIVQDEHRLAPTLGSARRHDGSADVMLSNPSHVHEESVVPTIEHQALSRAELDDIPLLTEVAPLDAIASEPDMDEATGEAADDFPVLTDAVEIDAAPALLEHVLPGDSGPITSEEDEALIGGLSAGAFGVVAASLAAHATSAPQEQSRLPHDDPRWATLAEEIRMQVLQRVDLFTETGLHDRLHSHLRPIVDRASAELVATINAHLGQVLRAYVAEAIEREIEKWRHDTR